MKLLRAKLLATGVILASVAGAGAANLSTLSGSQFSEPSQILNTINTLIQNINGGVSGLIAQTQSASGNGQGLCTTPFTPGVCGVTGNAAASNEQVLASLTLPNNTLTANGQTLRARCFGTTANNTNLKQLRLIISGTATQNGAIISTVQSTIANGAYELEMILTYNTAATSTWMGRGSAGGSLSGTNQLIVSPIVATNAVINFTNALTAQCNYVSNGSSNSAGDVTNSELIVESIK